MFGTYQEGEAQTENQVYFRGLRQRRWGLAETATLLRYSVFLKVSFFIIKFFFVCRKLDIIGSCEDGNYFYLCANSDSSRLNHEVWGHVCQADGPLQTITSCDLDLDNMIKGTFPLHFSIRLAAGSRQYHAILHLTPAKTHLFSGRPWQHRSDVLCGQLTLNARQGRVILMSTRAYHGDCHLAPERSISYLSQPNRQPTSSESQKLALLFSEEACRFDSLVGGKGSSLALLAASVDNSPVTCRVPSGFCVTLEAWSRQTVGTHFHTVFHNLENVANGVVDGHLEECCSKAQKLLLETPVDPSVREHVLEALQVTPFLEPKVCYIAKVLFFSIAEAIRR